MNLSTNFTLEEATSSSTAQRLGIDNSPSADQLTAMQYAASGMETVRAILGQPVHIDSWLRQPALNKAVGGAANSDHMKGFAVDFTCAAFGPPIVVVKALESAGIHFDQLIQEGSWVHISFNPAMRQQVLTAHFGPGGTTYSLGA